MTTKEKIEVMQAFVNGELVECKQKGSMMWGGLAVEEPGWDWLSRDCRIAQKPQYRPFNYDDHALFIGRAVIGKKIAKNCWTITRCHASGVILDTEYIPYDELLSHFTFIDKTPCGILLE